MKFKLLENTNQETDNEKLIRIWSIATRTASKVFPEELMSLIKNIQVKLSNRVSENGSFDVNKDGISICISKGRIKDTDEEVLSTLLHEIAHAFVFFFGMVMYNNPKFEEEHGPLWKITAKSLGESSGVKINPEKVSHESAGGVENYLSGAKYRVFCTSCGNEIVRFHRLTGKRRETIKNLILNSRCSICGGIIGFEKLR